MKSSPNFAGYNPSSLVNSDYIRPVTSSLSPHDLLNTASGDLDIRRFGFSNFDSDKNAFRCDGCDIVFSSRDTYAMHMLMRAKNESCVALPTSAISSNPENPTPREKFERELRQQAMLTALRSQATAMSKAAAAASAASVATASLLPKTAPLAESLTAMSHSSSEGKDVTMGTSSLAASTLGTASLASSSDLAATFGTLFSLENYGMYLDPRHYRRLLTEYGMR